MVFNPPTVAQRYSPSFHWDGLRSFSRIIKGEYLVHKLKTGDSVLIFTILSLICTTPLLAQIGQEFVISPTLNPTQIEHTTFDISTVTNDDISLESSYSVTDLIKDKAGITTIHSGSLGQQETVFIQGGDGDNMLVLLDGIKMNDASSPGGKFDLSLIDSSNIESIEVLKGPQSGLYGSGAFSGVLNIITRQEERTSSQISINSGAYSSYGLNASHNQNIGNFNFRIQSNLQKSQGYSNLLSGNEKDGHQYQTAQLKIKHKKNGQKTSLQFEYLKKKIDLDQWNQDDPNYTEDSENIRSHFSFSKLFFESVYKAKITYSFNKTKRHDLNLADSFSAITVDDHFKSQRHMLQQTNFFHWNQDNQTLLGFSYENEQMESNSVSDKSLDTFATFIQQENNISTIKTTFNIRYDHSSYNNNYLTYRLGFSTVLSNFTLQTSFSTATKNPTLYQLYSSYGNTNLKEEKQNGGNLSIIYHWTTGQIKCNYFNYKLTELIEYNFTTSKYFNSGNATRKGYELLLFQSFNAWKLVANYTYLLPIKSNGQYLERRPKHQVTASTTYQLGRKRIKLIATYIGERDSYSSSILKKVIKFDMKTSYKINTSTQLSLQWNNIFNKDYEMIRGYQTAGSSIFSKLTLNF